MSSPYLVPVAHIMRNIPASMEVNFVAQFDENGEFEPRGLGESDIAGSAEVAVAGRLESFSGGIRMRGVVRAPWTGMCRRCSVTVEGIMEIPVDERFTEKEGEDEEAYFFADDTVDLSHLVHDAVFLELPTAPLCREDCQGLCTICGLDRNLTPCDCQTPVDPRWATLSELRFDDDQSAESN